MQKLHLHKLFAAVMVAALLMVSFATMVWAMGETAPVQQQLRAREVRGTLTGGQFAQIWLGLQPESPGVQVTVVAEWDRNQPADQGLNFFILDDQGVRRVGDESLSSIALGSGSANFLLNGPANALGASFNANGLGPYTLVVTNDSSQDASFTLRVTNGFITDDSGQVVDPSAPTTAVTTTTTSDTAAVPATTAVTTTTATTATTAAPTAAPATTTTTTTVAATATPAPAAPAAPVVSGIARATSLSGSLPEQNDQHFLGLEPEGRDTQITLRLTIEPQDSSELARRLNFWVLDTAGFNQFIGGTDASDVAIAAGNRVFRGQENERVASFRATGTGSYVVIVYNNAAVPGTYGLSIEGGLLVDDNGQTNESQSAGVSGTGTITGTTATTGTATTTTATTTTPAVNATTATTGTTTTATTARTGQPGGTYTVQSGDTLALIARDIYGDLQLYDELCAFNNIADCNVIEVGDSVRLPTTAQISAGATAAPAAAATPRATATPAAAAPAATTAVTTTGTTTGTTTTAPSTTVQPGAAVTTTGTTTSTGTTTGSTAGGTTILDTLAANGNFNTLVKALEATGLDATLDGTSALTLLAPTDAAFVALRNEFSLTEEELLALPELAAVLRYHVLNGAVTSADITDGLTSPTVEGNTVRFGVNGAATTINGNANVIAADVEAGSGVIHVIDTVIIPPPAE